MRALLLALPLLASPSEVTSALHPEVPSRVSSEVHADDETGVLFDRGEDVGFVIPSDEELDFEVILDVAVVGETGIGQFRLSAGVEEQRAGLGAAQPGSASKIKSGPGIP